MRKKVEIRFDKHEQVWSAYLIAPSLNCVGASPPQLNKRSWWLVVRRIDKRKK